MKNLNKRSLRAPSLPMFIQLSARPAPKEDFSLLQLSTSQHEGALALYRLNYALRGVISNLKPLLLVLAGDDEKFFYIRSIIFLYHIILACPSQF